MSELEKQEVVFQSSCDLTIPVLANFSALSLHKGRWLGPPPEFLIQ